MQLWVFLHILFMFASITLSYGLVAFALISIRQRDVPAMRAYVRMSARVGLLEGILPLAGIAFGLVAAVAGGWDLFADWLVLAYLLIAASIVVTVIDRPYLDRFKAALEANAGEEPAGELAVFLDSRRVWVTSLAYLVIVTLLIADMVYKPVIWS